MDPRGRRGTRHPRRAPPRRGGDVSPRPERLPGGSGLEPQREPQPLPVRLAILRTLRRPDRESVRGRRVVRRQGPRKPPPRGGGCADAADRRRAHAGSRTEGARRDRLSGGPETADRIMGPFDGEGRRCGGGRADHRAQECPGLSQPLNFLRSRVHRETGAGSPRLRHRGRNRRGDVSSLERLAHARGPRCGVGGDEPDVRNAGNRPASVRSSRWRRPRRRSHGITGGPRRSRGEPDPRVPRPLRRHRDRCRWQGRRLRCGDGEAMKVGIVGGPGYTGGELLRLLLRHPTAAILAVHPLAKAGLIDPERLVVDAKTGSSAGGVDGGTASQHPERSGVMRIYAPAGHRHTAEIEQETGVKVALSCHAVEAVRGILATCHAFLQDSVTSKDLWRVYREAYHGEPFVRIVTEPAGLYRYPEPKILAGTNFCDVGFALDAHANRVVAVAALDNLMKGAAGTAVQCMNLVAGYPETMGLDFLGLHPVLGGWSR